MSSLMDLGRVFYILKRMITEDVQYVVGSSIEELAETVLKGGVDAANARVMLVFSQHPNKQEAWDRFARTTERLYGRDWRRQLDQIPNKQPGSDYPLIFACAGASCMELAWGRQCDQCLVRHLGQ